MSYNNPLSYDQVKGMSTPRLLAYYKKHRATYFALQQANGDFKSESLRYGGGDPSRAFYEGVEMVQSELNNREHVE